MENYNQDKEDAKLDRMIKRLCFTFLLGWELFAVIAALLAQDWMQLVYANIVTSAIGVFVLIFWLTGKVFK
jgi:hypothetical protein